MDFYDQSFYEGGWFSELTSAEGWFNDSQKSVSGGVPNVNGSGTGRTGTTALENGFPGSLSSCYS